MTISLDGKEYPTRRPKNLDEQLIAATGCNSSEIAAQLAGYPIAGNVARALRPFLGEDAPEQHELAVQIEETGLADVLERARRLYAKDAPEEAVE